MKTHNGSHKHSRQEVKQEQRLVVDQNYSNNICFHCLSTLESLANTYRGDHAQLYDNKMFRHYDTFDYSSKNRRELKIQLKTHLLIFKTSLQMFRNEHRGQQWMLPQNFNAQQVLNFAQKMKLIFSQNKDEESFYMTQDFINILGGNNTNLSFEKMNFGPELSQSQAVHHKNNFVSSAFKAQEHMEKQAERVRDVQDRSQLSANINHGNHFYQNTTYQHQGNSNLEVCYLLFEKKYSQLYEMISKVKIQDEIFQEAPYTKAQNKQTAERIFDESKKEGYFFKAGIDSQTRKVYKIGPIYKRDHSFFGGSTSQLMEKS